MLRFSVQNFLSIKYLVGLVLSLTVLLPQARASDRSSDELEAYQTHSRHFHEAIAKLPSHDHTPETIGFLNDIYAKVILWCREDHGRSLASFFRLLEESTKSAIERPLHSALRASKEFLGYAMMSRRWWTKPEEVSIRPIDQFIYLAQSLLYVPRKHVEQGVVDITPDDFQRFIDLQDHIGMTEGLKFLACNLSATHNFLFNYHATGTTDYLTCWSCLNHQPHADHIAFDRHPCTHFFVANIDGMKRVAITGDDYNDLLNHLLRSQSKTTVDVLDGSLEVCLTDHLRGNVSAKPVMAQIIGEEDMSPARFGLMSYGDCFVRHQASIVSRIKAAVTTEVVIEDIKDWIAQATWEGAHDEIYSIIKSVNARFAEGYLAQAKVVMALVAHGWVIPVEDAKDLLIDAAEFDPEQPMVKTTAYYILRALKSEGYIPNWNAVTRSGHTLGDLLYFEGIWPLDNTQVANMLLYKAASAGEESILTEALRMGPNLQVVGERAVKAAKKNRVSEAFLARMLTGFYARDFRMSASTLQKLVMSICLSPSYESTNISSPLYNAFASLVDTGQLRVSDLQSDPEHPVALYPMVFKRLDWHKNGFTQTGIQDSKRFKHVEYAYGALFTLLRLGINPLDVATADYYLRYPSYGVEPKMESFSGTLLETFYGTLYGISKVRHHHDNLSCGGGYSYGSGAEPCYHCCGNSQAAFISSVLANVMDLIPIDLRDHVSLGVVRSFKPGSLYVSLDSHVVNGRHVLRRSIKAPAHRFTTTKGVRQGTIVAYRHKIEGSGDEETPEHSHFVQLTTESLPDLKTSLGLN